MSLQRHRLCRTPQVRFQIQRNVHAWVILSRCETTSCAHDIRSQDSRKYSVGNATISMAYTSKNSGGFKTKKRIGATRIPVRNV
jgi:hypothetical protein